MSDFNDGLLPTPCLRMDTHFGDEYESIEFGDGTGYIKAAPILAKVGALHGEIDRLRERIHELEMEGSDHFYRTAYAEDANRTLEAENAKLRELVRDIADHVNHGDGFGIDRGWMLDRMRELGIEVDA